MNLSTFFPPDTEYFYSFPAGEDSSFFNNVPSWREELVAVRPLICAGPNVKVVTFSATQKEDVVDLFKKTGVPIISPNKIIVLPSEINSTVHGKKRNTLIKKALKEQTSEKKLIMAQPFLDKKLENLYQFDPKITVWLNDKKNLPCFVDKKYLPQRFYKFKDGKDFSNKKIDFKIPCVIKVSSSSSGDGVRICRTENDIKKAKKEFSKIKGTIVVEDFINSVYNLGIQFGIPYDKQKPIKIIGFNEQIVSGNGDYLGAVVNLNKEIKILDDIYKVLLSDILPKVRELGWYGVGGFDVLVDCENNFYFIDSNFRMTAITSYLYLIKNKFIQRSIVCFTGVFKGDKQSFEKVIQSLGGYKNKTLQIVSLSNYGHCYHFNAAMFFNNEKDIPLLAERILSKGISSKVLSRFSKIKNYELGF